MQDNKMKVSTYYLCFLKGLLLFFSLVKSLPSAKRRIEDGTICPKLSHGLIRAIHNRIRRLPSTELYQH